MDDVFRRLGMVEADVSGIKADVSGLKIDMAAIKAQIPYLAAKSDVGDAKNSIIQWMIGTTIAAASLAASLAFVIAKLIH